MMRPPIPRRSKGAAALVLALAGCGGDAQRGARAPRWIELAAGFVPEPRPLPDAGIVPTGRPGRVHVVTDVEAGEWLDHGGGLWSRPRRLPRPLLEGTPRGAPTLVRLGGRAVRQGARGVRPRLEELGEEALPPGRMRGLLQQERPCSVTTDERVYLLLEEGAAPAGATVEEPLGVGFEADGRWRLRLARSSADAVPVLPGQRVELRLDLPPAAVLSFRTLALGEEGSAFRFLVRADDRLLADLEVPSGRRAPQRVRLPPEGGETLLSLEVQGDPGLAAFLNPVVGPADVGAPGARPWTVRPDVVVLMADTFRADNLAAWGGDPELAPAIGRFAEGARCFTGTRAPATWTLPSHASLFAARYPYEIGVEGKGMRLGGGARTLAEHLRAAGYRTVAVTDSGYVSATFGLDQGFEHFGETGRMEDEDMEQTVAAVERVLAVDDGRPLFLFVQSYRAHTWVVSEATRARLGERYAFRPNEEFHSEELRERLVDLLRESPHGEPMRGPEYESLVLPMTPNYRGGAADAAEGFGRVLDLLRDRGGTDRSLIVFTSDHGEAFGEQGVVGHGNGVWEVQARVPLVLAAPQVAPGVDPRPASLIDLPRTLCSLAGIEPHASWGGVDLTAPPDPDRSVFVFQCMPEVPQYVAAIRGGWKLIFEDDGGPGELRFAYDLEADPEETRDRSGSTEVRHGAEEVARETGALFGRRIEAETAEVDERVRERLEELGYGGSD